MIRRELVIFVVFLITTATAEAGKIYGSLQVDGQPIASGTKIEIKCSEKRPYKTTIKRHGRYSVSVRKEGLCSFSVGGYTGASINVVSYKEATRYNFILSRSGSGFSIRRK